MSFEFFDAMFEDGEGLGRNSKFNIENSKSRNTNTAPERSESQISENGALFPETR